MDSSKEKPIIVGFVSDLLFTTRIENVAHHLGFRLAWIASALELGSSEGAPVRESPGESLRGQSGRLFGKLTRWQPALLLFDLANRDVPWRKWIAALKSSPATRRMPIMCYGPHVEVDKFNEAKSVGADVVLARSRFTADMPRLIQQYARLPDYAALETACGEPLSELARKGITLHNQGQYFEAHEAFEEAWIEDVGPGRDLYRGMVQFSVAYLQFERKNYRGAIKMCLRVRQWLTPLPAICRGVDVAWLRQSVGEIHQALEMLGPERLDELDGRLLRPIRYATDDG